MYGLMNFTFLVGGALMPHLALGMVIAVFAVFVFAISALVPSRNLLLATAGLVSVLFAGGAGISFMPRRCGSAFCQEHTARGREECLQYIGDRGFAQIAASLSRNAI